MGDFVRYPHPALSRPATARPVDAAMRVAGDALLAAVQAANAYGLAAAHLGKDEPVVVISVADDPGVRDYRLLYNPRVVEAAGEQASGAEGSVSLPGVEVEVQRRVWVQLAFDDAGGRPQALRLQGFPARVAQHEIDQMNGVFFLARLSRLKRDAALRKFEKSLRR